jgi:hypothetical protein
MEHTPRKGHESTPSRINAREMRQLGQFSRDLPINDQIKEEEQYYPFHLPEWKIAWYTNNEVTNLDHRLGNLEEFLRSDSPST